MKGIIKFLKRLVDYPTGEREKYPMEQRLFNVMGFYSGLIGLGALVINLYIDIRIDLTILAFVASLVSWFVFYLSRFAKRINTGKWIYTIFIFGILTYFFFINNGSRGPLLFLYMAFFLFVLYVWDGWARKFFIIVFQINIIVFFICEYYYPGSTKPYADEKSRLLDLYLSYFMYVAFMGTILMFAKNGYRREKLRAEQSDKLKTAFLANMSHEIRTPMNAIMGFTQLLRKNLPQEKKEKYIDIVHESGQSLMRIIDDIIDVSKIEAGEISLVNSAFDPAFVIRDLEETFKQFLSDYPDRKVAIKTAVPVKETTISGDSDRIRQVLSNFMSNALKYTTEGEIVIGYVCLENTMRFFVRDTGSGIKPEHLEEIFERFRKIETKDSIKVNQGTGIGLSISKTLIELMGGQVYVKSEYGKGSEFGFTLPH